MDRCHSVVHCHFREVLPAFARHISFGIAVNVLHVVRTFFRFERDYRDDTKLVDYRDDTKWVDWRAAKMVDCTLRSAKGICQKTIAF